MKIFEMRIRAFYKVDGIERNHTFVKAYEADTFPEAKLKLKKELVDCEFDQYTVSMIKLHRIDDEE